MTKRKVSSRRLRAGQPGRGLCTGLLCLAILAAARASDRSGPSLDDMSLEDLGRVLVTSVSKAPEPLNQASAAIYVITQDDIRRSGATTLAEALRLAPNMRITQLAANNFVASIRGFGGRPDVQNFSNKLLLLIDGRTVYSPLFSGIYLDTQDVLMSDINRIEVISGAGATLWGANAMNGVINVITQPAWLTAGPTATLGAGNQEREFAARYGGKAGENTAYRVYAKGFERDALNLADDTSAEDGWRRGQAGFRMDIDMPGSTTTLQGDVYGGTNDKAGAGSQSLAGANVLGRWEKQTDSSRFHIQGYFDQVRRGAPVDGARFEINTFDIEAQQGLSWGSRHQLVWGGGLRLHSYQIANTETLLFDPAQRKLHIGNLFAQDSMMLGPTLKLTLGVKLEHNSYTGWEPQPDARLVWQASDSTMLWAAASRAVRAPTPFDTDVVERVGGSDFLVGNPEFRSENVLAYETGFRSIVSPAFSLSMSVFYNRYDDLRTIEVSDTPDFLPLRWGNLMKGHTYGATAWATWQVTGRWRIAPGFALLQKRLHQTAEASGLLDVGQSGNDPHGHAQLISSLDLGRNQTLDLALRHVGKLPDPALPAYTEMSARFAWRVAASWELAVSGRNLLHKAHHEYPAPSGVSIDRSVLAEVRWRP